MKKFMILIVVLCLLFTGCSSMESLKHDDLKREYIIHVPSSYNGSAMPLVLNFHGGGGTAKAAQKQSGYDAKADAEGFIVVYPEGVCKKIIFRKSCSWNGGPQGGGASYEQGIDDVGYISALIEELSSQYNIDRTRVYATGLSMGGMMSYRLACELSDKITAIAPIATSMVVNNCSPTRPVPVMHFQGTADKMVPYDGGFSDSSIPDLFVVGGPYKSTEEVIDFWSAHNDCKQSYESYKRGDVTCVKHTGCDQNAEVVLCTIDGGGHTWPGGTVVNTGKKWSEWVGKVTDNISATDASWDFFKEFSKSAFGAGDYVLHYEFENVTREVGLHVPKNYNRTGAPLVIALHGGGGKWISAQDGSRYNEKSDEEGIIVVYPNSALKGTWNIGPRPLDKNRESSYDDVGFISFLIDDLAEKYAIDTKRVYATGLSMGGMMTYRLACELSDKITAIAPVGTSVMYYECNPTRAVPVVHFHGTADKYVPYLGGASTADTPEFIRPNDIMRPAVESVGIWVGKNNCTNISTVAYHNGDVTCIDYGKCAQNASVQLCTIQGGGHTWPNGSYELDIAWYRNQVGNITQDVSARDYSWDFFSKYALP